MKLLPLLGFLVFCFFTTTSCSGDIPLEAGDVNLLLPGDLFLHNQKGGRVIDVTRIPDFISDHDAWNDGTHPEETTDALIDIYDWILLQLKTVGNVSHHGHLTSYILYFPEGTYLVNDQIIHRGEPWLRNNNHENLYGIRFYGQNRTNVIIRLADNAPGFGDKDNPKAVISFNKHDRNNSVSTNILQNMTVNLGAGNPGAIGVDFEGANMATVRNLAVLSEDGEGYAGLRLPIWPTQGFYKDIFVEGLDIGIDVVGGMVANGPVFEDILLTNQKKAGFRVQATLTPVRHLTVRNCEGPAVQMTTNTGHLVIFDSRFENCSDAHAAIQVPPGCQSLYARNITLEGSTQCISIGDKLMHEGNLNGEFIAGDPKGLFEGQKLASLNLPIEETPDMPYDPPSKWISVESMGATGGDDTDDTQAIQGALNACDGKEKNTVYFRSPGEFYISGGLKVPAGVKRLIFFWGGRINSERLMPEDGSQFIITEPSEDPVIFEDYFQHVNGNRGYFMDHAAERTVICRNFRGSRDFSNYKHTSPNRETRLFLENTCHMIGEGSWFDNVCYARWINTETADEVEFLNSGGRFWVLGYKCESAAINFRTVNGGYTEALGGIINQYRSNDELYNASHVFELVDASGSFIAGASGPDDHDYDVVIKETRNGETRTLLKDDFPIREDNKIHVPLFAGYARGQY